VNIIKHVSGGYSRLLYTRHETPKNLPQSTAPATPPLEAVQDRVLAMRVAVVVVEVRRCIVVFIAAKIFRHIKCASSTK